MDLDLDKICAGCLCIERKIKPLEELSIKQFYIRVIDEMLPMTELLWLCWECEALVTRFYRFKVQAKESYAALKNSVTQSESSVKLKRPPKLTICKLFNVHINEILDSHKLLKTENNYEFQGQMKLEGDSDNISIRSVYISDDERALIEFSSGKKGKRKRNEKEMVEVSIDGITMRNGEVDAQRRRLELTEDYANVFNCEKCVISFPNGDDLKEHYNLNHKKSESVVKFTNLSNLTGCKILNINVPNIIEADMTIKTENDEESENQTKTECDRASVYSGHNSDDDEDMALIEFCKGKKAKRKKKKRENAEVMFKQIELNNGEVEAERRGMELREDYVNAMFRCEKCIISFPNGDDLNDHLNLKHVQNAAKFKCSICNCSFGSEVSYRYHTDKHWKRYECTVCGERYPTKRSASKHCEATHRLCVGVDVSIGNDDQFNGSLHHNSQDQDAVKQDMASFPCHLCEKKFRWKTSLRKHVERHSIETGQKRKPYCEPCKLSFTTTSNLQKHVKASSNHQIQLKLRKLREADEASNPENQQARIEQIKHSILNSKKQYQCMQCEKRFQWRGNLLRHVESHTARANGELVCGPCNRTFSSIATYKQHMKISKKHVSEKDFEYMCSDCGKRFANKTRLKDHVDWEHLKNYVHKCTVCQKVFKSYTSLYLHKQVVHKENNVDHLCDHCGKSFPNRAKLRSHITALHTTEAPYKCESCGARFSWHSCLSRHVRRKHRRLPRGGGT